MKQFFLPDLYSYIVIDIRHKCTCFTVTMVIIESICEMPAVLVLDEWTVAITLHESLELFNVERN